MIETYRYEGELWVVGYPRGNAHEISTATKDGKRGVFIFANEQLANSHANALGGVYAALQLQISEEALMVLNNLKSLGVEDVYANTGDGTVQQMFLSDFIQQIQEST